MLGVILNQMSTNQRILLVSLACMAVVAGLFQLSGPSGSDADAAASTTLPRSQVSAALPTSTSLAPSSPASATAPSAVPSSVAASSSTAPAATSTTAAATTAAAKEPAGQGCPDSARGAVIDRNRQRAWLCDHGASTGEFPITTARTQPLPGTYKVYAKDLKATSNFGGHFSTMTHFVAFTKGRYTGARIAFHSVPKLSNGTYVQSFDSVGTKGAYGESSGCIRVLPDQAVKIWNWLRPGDKVAVIN